MIIPGTGMLLSVRNAYTGSRVDEQKLHCFFLDVFYFVQNYFAIKSSIP